MIKNLLVTFSAIDDTLMMVARNFLPRYIVFDEGIIDESIRIRL